MAEYTINKFTYGGNTYKLQDDNAVTDVQVNGISVVSSGVASIPLAGATTIGVVSTSDQTIAGSKTFTSTIRIDAGTGSEGIAIDSQAITGNSLIYAPVVATNNVYHTNNIQFLQKSYNSSTGVGLSYNELYRLPTVDADLSANANYDILTTKNAVTIAQGGTGATTAANAKANLELGTASMNFSVYNLSSTASQQWMLKSNVINSSNSHYGNSTALCIIDDGIFLGEWDSSDAYLGAIWTITPGNTAVFG